jgi:uncharacterized membrane protein YedE/YeeE
MHAGAFPIALAAVGTMGFANQRGGTCTVAALEEVILKGRFKRLIALFEASLWVGAGFVLLNAAGLLATIPVDYAAGVGTMAGGVLFGIGAFVNRACVFGTISRLGSGELPYLATPVGFYLGSLTTAYLPGPTQLDDRSPLISATTWLALLIIPLIFVRIYMHLRQMRRTGRGLWVHIWSPHVATTIIGITFLVTTVTQQDWTYSQVLADLAHGMTFGLRPKVLLGAALLAGAMLGGVTARRFKIAAPDLAGVVRHLAGGILMGAGGLLIPGGNTDLALVGLPLLWPYAWLAFMSICITIYIGLRLSVLGRPTVGDSRSAGRLRPRSRGLN